MGKAKERRIQRREKKSGSKIKVELREELIALLQPNGIAFESHFHCRSERVGREVSWEPQERESEIIEARLTP